VQAGGNARELCEHFGGVAGDRATAVLAIDQVAERDHFLGLGARPLPTQRSDYQRLDTRRCDAQLLHGGEAACLAAQAIAPATPRTALAGGCAAARKFMI
jgi:hypothetical protein